MVLTFIDGFLSLLFYSMIFCFSIGFSFFFSFFFLLYYNFSYGQALKVNWAYTSNQREDTSGTLGFYSLAVSLISFLVECRI